MNGHFNLKLGLEYPILIFQVTNGAQRGSPYDRCLKLKFVSALDVGKQLFRI